jgi:hypothetical protein
MLSRYFLIIFLTAAARFFLVLNFPIQIRPSDLQADGLFAQLAANMAPVARLAKFDPSTLQNGPGYSFFLAVTSISGLPLVVAHALFQIAAMAAAGSAVLRLTRSQGGAAATFLALALCPAGLVLHRVIPDQIYWAQILLVFALIAIIAFVPPRGRVSAAVTAGTAGTVAGWAWLTRDEGIWLLPAFVFLVAGAVLAIGHRRDELLALVRNLCVATAAFIAVIVACVATNFDVSGSLAGDDSPPVKTHQWASLPRELIAAAETVWQAATPSSSISVESPELRRYWTLLNKPSVNAVQPNREITMMGNYYDYGSTAWPVIKVYAQNGQEIPSTVTRLSSPDLQPYFPGPASFNRFKIMFVCPDVCAIAALAADGSELRLEEGFVDARGSARLHIESVSGTGGSLLDPAEKLAASVSLALIGIYEGLLSFLLPIGLIATVAVGWRAFGAQALPPVLLTALAAWLLTATRVISLAWIKSGAFPAVIISYGAPATYMAIFAACLSLTALSIGSRYE